MEYKGYKAVIEYDDDAKLFHGEVFGVRDVITFQGICVDELEQALKDSVEDYLEFCEERGVKPEKPFSGNFNVRIKPEIHEQVALQAKKESKSMNQWISEKLESAIR